MPFDRAIDAYWRALKLKQTPEREELRVKFEEALRLRLGAPTDSVVSGATEYLDELTSEPLPDPAAAIKPVRKNPPGVIIIKNNP